MTQLSGFWTTNSGTSATGHQQASYTQAQWSIAARILSACAGFEGVAPNYLNNLSVTATAANTVAVNTGGAVVDGKWYLNDASLDVNVPSASGAGNTRIDRVVLRCTWADYHVEVFLIPGTAAPAPTAPAITQTSGTTYDILLYQVLVDEAGTCTVTSERTFASVGAAGIGNDVVNSQHYAAGSIDLEHMSANSIDSDQYVDGSIDLAHLSADCVDDTKVGNRVPQFYRRQGGSSTVWSTAGDTSYTPTTVRMQSGSQNVAGTATEEITFPVAFSYAPIVILTPFSDSSTIEHPIVNKTGHSATSFYVINPNLAALDVFWLAIGPE